MSTTKYTSAESDRSTLPASELIAENERLRAENRALKSDSRLFRVRPGAVLKAFQETGLVPDQSVYGLLPPNTPTPNGLKTRHPRWRPNAVGALAAQRFGISNAYSILRSLEDDEFAFYMAILREGPDYANGFTMGFSEPLFPEENSSHYMFGYADGEAAWLDVAKFYGLPPNSSAR